MFLGAERKFWEGANVFLLSGLCAGLTPNPTYEEVCSGLTGHNEVVRLYLPLTQLFEKLLQSSGKIMIRLRAWHREMILAQYRSGIYTFSRHKNWRPGQITVWKKLQQAGYGPITTEIIDAPCFYYAEDYHQQYLGKTLMVIAGWAERE